MAELKEIKIIKDTNGMFYAKYKQGGQLPAVLGGMWTHEADLKSRINNYLRTRPAQSPTQRRVAKTKKTEGVSK
jgi:hypothetical protein